MEDNSQGDYEDSQVVENSCENSPEVSEDMQDNEMPVLELGQKKSMEVYTYVELHWFVRGITTLLENAFELGILKGSAQCQACDDSDKCQTYDDCDEQHTEKNETDDAGKKDREKADITENVDTEQYYYKDQVCP